MNIYELNLPVIYLKPCELVFSDAPAIMTTVLGSCVSITMFNARTGIAAICHALLPACQCNDECRGDCTKCGLRRHSCRKSCGEGEAFKYVDCAIYEILDRFRSAGISIGEIETKIFGGSDMFEQNGEKTAISVGVQNVKTALRVIKREGLLLGRSDVGGSGGRKIFFNTRTGFVLLKRIETGNIRAHKE